MRIDRSEAIALGLIAIAALARLVLLAQPIGGDPGIYAYVGGRILAGDVPYTDVFEQKPPGILYTYALAFTLAGRSMVAVQLLDLVAWASTVGLVAVLAARLFSDRVVTFTSAALAAFFINPSLQSSFRQVGQAETWIGMWATASVYLAFGTRRVAGAHRDASAFAAGICCALASLYKYNAAIYLLPCLVALSIGEGRHAPLGWRVALRPVVALLLGFAMPIGVCGAYFWSREALGDLVSATIIYNAGYVTDGYDSPGEFAKRAAVMTYRFASTNLIWMTAGVGGLVLSARAAKGSLNGVVLLCFAAAAYLSILVNAKFYPQYFLQILPPLAIMAGVGLTAVCRATTTRQRLAAALVLCVLLSALIRHGNIPRFTSDVVAAARFVAGRIPAEDYYRRFGAYESGGDFSFLADERLAQMISATTSPSDPVYIYGGEPLVLFLANRASPSKFLWNDPFVAGAMRTRFTHRDLVAELSRQLPAYFIVLRNDANLIDPVDSLSQFLAQPDLRAFVTDHYEERGWMEDFLIFERRR